MDYTDYRNDYGELLYKTDDDLSDIIIVPDKNINKLEETLNELHSKETINDAEANKQKLHILGDEILKYKDKNDTGNQNQDVGFPTGYGLTIEGKSTEMTDLFYTLLSLGGIEGAEMKVGYLRGKAQGKEDRLEKKINILKPFESIKNNKPLLTIPRLPHIPKHPGVGLPPK